MSELAPTVRGLLAYTMWADRVVLEALATVPDGDLKRDAGASFGSMLGTLAHILGSEQVWLSRFLGVPLGKLPTPDQFPDLPSIAASFEDFWPQLEFFIASLTEEQLARDFTWVNLKGETHTRPYRQVLVHFANHSTYHRGQIVLLMRQMGYTPPSTDLVYWRGAL